GAEGPERPPVTPTQELRARAGRAAPRRHARPGGGRRPRSARTRYRPGRPGLTRPPSSHSPPRRTREWPQLAPLPVLTDLVALEVGVLDDAEPVAERVAHRRHLDAAADVFHRLVDLCPQRFEAGQLRRRVRDAPV